DMIAYGEDVLCAHPDLANTDRLELLDGKLESNLPDVSDVIRSHVIDLLSDEEVAKWARSPLTRRSACTCRSRCSATTSTHSCTACIGPSAYERWRRLGSPLLVVGQHW